MGRPIIGRGTSHHGTWDVPIPYIRSRPSKVPPWTWDVPSWDVGRTYTLHSFSQLTMNVSIVKMCSNVMYTCMLQFACEHRRSSRDPHPSCELCREASQLPLCTPQDWIRMGLYGTHHRRSHTRTRSLLPKERTLSQGISQVFITFIYHSTGW